MPAASPDERIVLTGAQVLTMNPRQPRADAVGVRGGEIAVVGLAADVREALGDPLDTDPDRLTQVRVRGTWLAGRRVFG
jgi:predicted amidohydrolase YtcJ